MRISHDTAVADALSRDVPEPTPRETRPPRMPGKVDAIVGMRRVGKSWLCFDLMQALWASGTPRGHCLYLDFDDDRLGAIDGGDLTGLYDAYLRAVPDAVDARTWVFLDEIQNVAGWEKFVRRLGATPNVHVTVTGSSASLLSREIATSLRGRGLATELLPFSFSEALRHRGVERPERLPPGNAERNRLAVAFDRWLEVGGFPEVQSVEERLRFRVLQDYVDAAVFRDVVERHSVRHVEVLNRLVRRIVRNPGTRLSLHKFYNDVRSQGLRIGKDALYPMLDWLEDAYLCLTVPLFTDSERARQNAPRKVYPIDPGLARAFSWRPQPGHLLETAVFVELRRRGHQAAFLTTAGGFEVDFAYRDAGGLHLVQASADVQDEATLQRELRALDDALAQHPEATATLVTLHTAQDVKTEHGAVRVVPGWQWALEGDR